MWRMSEVRTEREDERWAGGWRKEGRGHTVQEAVASLKNQGCCKKQERFS